MQQNVEKAEIVNCGRCEMLMIQKDRLFRSLRIFFVLSLLASCSQPKQKEVGQFVYADCFHTIHIDRSCASKLADNPRTKEERMANMQGVSFIDTCDLTSNRIAYNNYVFCPRCVDDDAYQHLKDIVNRHEVKPPAY